MRLTTEKFLPRLEHRESQRRLELDSLLPEVVLRHDIRRVQSGIVEEQTRMWYLKKG